MKKQTYPIDWLDEALAPIQHRYTPVLMCACGCGDHVAPDQAFWLGCEPYKNTRHAAVAARTGNE